MQKLFKKCGSKVCEAGIKTFGVLIFSTILSVTAYAFTYVPNTFADPVITTLNNATGEINGGTTISLRSALMAADNLGGTHTITLSTGTYNLTQAIPDRQITIGNTEQNITINGNGPANTIINMTADADKDRILFINPTGGTKNVITVAQGIRFQNGYLSSDPYGGAGICAGGGSGNALTVTNCIFDNNILPAGAFGGAAVCMQISGNLTVDNCTFTNNVSNDADGGAIFFIIYSGDGYSGDLLVTNSTFTGNSVNLPGAGTSNGGAISFIGQEGIVGSFSTTINNNTFINNTADGFGGAISADNSPDLSISQIHFNRFFNNTSTSSALSSGLHFVESSGSVNAENNWWGCNTNPVSGASASPCNQAGGDVAGGGSLDANPWLQLKVTAVPSTICSGNTSNITASFLNNSDGTAIPVADLSRLIGLPVTWGPTSLGSLSGQETTIQASGTATALFTSNGTGGTATVNAQVDNVPASETSPARASITVTTSSTAPTGATGTTTICNGSSTTLTVVGGSKGAGATTEWFTGSCGSTSAGTGDAIIVSPTTTTTYFVRYTGACNTTTCATITVTVNTLSTAPTGATGTTSICTGSSTTLTVDGGSKGTGATTEWFTGSCGGTPAGTGDAINVSPTTTTTYYVRYNGACNTTTCATVTVTVNNPSVAPSSISGTTTICNPGSTTLTAVGGTLGTGANYQWGTGGVVGTSPIGGAINSTLTVSPASTTTFWVRIENNAAPCPANTSGVTQTVTVNQPSVSPTGATGTTTICSGSSTTLTVDGGSKGTGATTEWFTGSCGGTPAGTGDAINVSPGSNTTYYVRYTGTCNTTTCASVTITVNQLPTVNAPTVVQPTCATPTGTITVNASGSGTLEYSIDGGANWFLTNAFSGLTPGNYNISVRSQSAPSCVSVYSGNPVILIAASNCCTPVNSGTVASGDQTICNGGDPSNITFSIAPSGGAAGGSFDYQWYYKNGVEEPCPAGTNTSGWTLISGATGNSYDPPSGLTTSRTYAVTVDPTGTPDCAVANWANSCRKVTVGTAVVATCSNNNPALYFGYAGDQTATIKANATGGTAPYTISITMNRPLNCNVITSSGDELWTASSGTSVNNVCPVSGPGLLPPVSTGTGIASGVDYSVNVTLMQYAIFTATITDANGCVSTCTTTIHAEDVRCFAGNSGNAKVSICHQTGSPSNPCVKICVAESAVAAHLEHGDFLGNCTPDCVAPVYTRGVVIEEKPVASDMFLVKVIPNPTDNYFTLDVGSRSNEKIVVVVYDVLGRIVKHIENIDGQLIRFGEDLKVGSYLAVIRKGNITKTVKLLKQ